ncbi:MAG TPA: GDSL-type esterase/lipase family protein [Planococcus sp. (in: firmicutes)]|nr:GDSL-type esterase/lipase family protein [Planococcus sp. (in: firmicutes)]
MSKLIRFLIVFVLALSLPMTTALAHDNHHGHGKETLVSLGDSVPFGVSPDRNNERPAKYAFPYLIGDKADLKVRNLAVPGWTTEELLTALEENKNFRQAVRRADYVTVNIGGNDFMEILNAAYTESQGNTELFHKLLQQKLASTDAFDNLNHILHEIRSLNHEPVVLYNVYNPFQQNDPFHQVADMYLPQINAAYKALADSYRHVELADSYSAFGDNQAKYVIPNDIHPTKAGHARLAKIGLRALSHSHVHH